MHSTFKIVAGETFSYNVTLDDYPNPPYESKMVFTSADNAYTIEGSAVGTVHSFYASPDETLTYEPGDYKYRIIVTDSVDIYTAKHGRAKVLPDPNVPGNNLSHVEKVLAALNATIEGRATSDVLNYSIRGRSLGRMSPQELLSWRDKYLQFLEEEIREEEMEQGGAGGGHGIIRVRL